MQSMMAFGRKPAAAAAAAAGFSVLQNQSGVYSDQQEGTFQNVKSNKDNSTRLVRRNEGDEDKNDEDYVSVTRATYEEENPRDFSLLTVSDLQDIESTIIDKNSFDYLLPSGLHPHQKVIIRKEATKRYHEKKERIKNYVL